LSRMRDLEPADPVKRYERQNPGDDVFRFSRRSLGSFTHVEPD
jgi:hypothetical protein